MSKAGSIADRARALVDWIPVCHWSFNQGRCFHYIGGEAGPVFHRTAPELLHLHVSAIDDPTGSWTSVLDRILGGDTRFESTTPASPDQCAIVHLPIHAAHGAVAFAAGFAYRANQPMPQASELEFAAHAVLQVVTAERARTDRFLHDAIAQCLSSTGLELEVLRLELQALGVALPSRAQEVQSSLEEALNQIRRFRTDETNRT
jgi:signal transduction histidine kinase